MVYVVCGDVMLDGECMELGMLVILVLGVVVVFKVVGEMVFMILGGVLLDGLCFVWWNFVVILCEKIEVVKLVWNGCDKNVFLDIFGEIEWILLLVY